MFQNMLQIRAMKRWSRTEWEDYLVRAGAKGLEQIISNCPEQDVISAAREKLAALADTFTMKEVQKITAASKLCAASQRVWNEVLRIAFDINYGLTPVDPHQEVIKAAEGLGFDAKAVEDRWTYKPIVEGGATNEHILWLITGEGSGGVKKTSPFVSQKDFSGGSKKVVMFDDVQWDTDGEALVMLEGKQVDKIDVGKLIKMDDRYAGRYDYITWDENFATLHSKGGKDVCIDGEDLLGDYIARGTPWFVYKKVAVLNRLAHTNRTRFLENLALMSGGRKDFLYARRLGGEYKEIELEDMRNILHGTGIGLEIRKGKYRRTPVSELWVTDYTEDRLAKLQEPDFDAQAKEGSMRRKSIRGHECDACSWPLNEDDYVDASSWSYTCPHCGFKYVHGMEPLDEQLESQGYGHFDRESARIISVGDVISDDVLKNYLRFDFVTKDRQGRPLSLNSDQCAISNGKEWFICNSMDDKVEILERIAANILVPPKVGDYIVTIEPYMVGAGETGGSRWQPPDPIELDIPAGVVGKVCRIESEISKTTGNVYGTVWADIVGPMDGTIFKGLPIGGATFELSDWGESYTLANPSQVAEFQKQWADAMARQKAEEEAESRWYKEMEGSMPKRFSKMKEMAKRGGVYGPYDNDTLRLMEDVRQKYGGGVIESAFIKGYFGIAAGQHISGTPFMKEYNCGKQQAAKDGFTGTWDWSSGKGHFTKACVDMLEEAGGSDKTAGVKFDKDKQKWFGWSHRGKAGFGVGSVVKKGDVIEDESEGEKFYKDGKGFKAGFKAKTLEDAKKMAELYAERVSSKKIISFNPDVEHAEMQREFARWEQEAKEREKFEEEFVEAIAEKLGKDSSYVYGWVNDYFQNLFNPNEWWSHAYGEYDKMVKFFVDWMNTGLSADIAEEMVGCGVEPEEAKQLAEKGYGKITPAELEKVFDWYSVGDAPPYPEVMEIIKKEEAEMEKAGSKKEASGGPDSEHDKEQKGASKVAATTITEDLVLNYVKKWDKKLTKSKMHDSYGDVWEAVHNELEKIKRSKLTSKETGLIGIVMFDWIDSDERYKLHGWSNNNNNNDDEEEYEERWGETEREGCKKMGAAPGEVVRFKEDRTKGGTIDTIDPTTGKVRVRMEDGQVIDKNFEELEKLASADDEPPAADCPVCGAENYPMGSLGRRMWYRCQQCGMEYSKTMSSDDLDKYIHKLRHPEVFDVGQQVSWESEGSNYTGKVFDNTDKSLLGVELPGGAKIRVGRDAVVKSAKRGDRKMERQATEPRLVKKPPIGKDMEQMRKDTKSDNLQDVFEEASGRKGKESSGSHIFDGKALSSIKATFNKISGRVRSNRMVKYVKQSSKEKVMEGKKAEGSKKTASDGITFGDLPGAGGKPPEKLFEGKNLEMPDISNIFDGKPRGSDEPENPFKGKEIPPTDGKGSQVFHGKELGKGGAPGIKFGSRSDVQAIMKKISGLQYKPEFISVSPMTGGPAGVYYWNVYAHHGGSGWSMGLKFDTQEEAVEFANYVGNTYGIPVKIEGEEKKGSRIAEVVNKADKVKETDKGLEFGDLPGDKALSDSERVFKGKELSSATLENIFDGKPMGSAADEKLFGDLTSKKAAKVVEGKLNEFKDYVISNLRNDHEPVLYDAVSAAGSYKDLHNVLTLAGYDPSNMVYMFAKNESVREPTEDELGKFFK